MRSATAFGLAIITACEAFSSTMLPAGQARWAMARTLAEPIVLSSVATTHQDGMLLQAAADEGVRRDPASSGR